MSAITVKGLKVTACHGVLPEEKITPQPFIFDISIDCDIYSAALSDDVSATVNYAEVCQTVTDFCVKNTFDLIETLAYKTAFLLAEKFVYISAVEVTVHKPQAPVGLPFSDIGVSARVEKNKVVLSLGSNLGDGKETLDGAIGKIIGIDGVTFLKVSQYMKSAPYGGVADKEFTNCALLLECLLPPRALLNEIHKIEADFGRTRETRWGNRTLDIDIVFFGNKIIAEEGLCVPHPDYFNRDFVLLCVKQIAPDFVCPVKRKRMSDF